jgi:membrane protein
VRAAALRWRFLWHDVRRFVARVYEGAADANVPFLASGLTFDALLAAIPLVLVLLSLVGHFVQAGAEAARVDLSEYVRRFFPAVGPNVNAFREVMELLEGAARERGTLGAWGLPLFVWFATRLFGSLRAALCEVFDTEENRSWPVGKAVDVALVLTTGLLFVANTALTEGWTFLARRNVGFGFLEYFGAQVLAFLFILLLFVIVFRFAPARRIRWDTAVVAALTCAFGFELAKPVLGLAFGYLVRPDALVSDANLGALLVFVAWTYYMTYVFLVGGAIAQVYELRRRQAAQRAWLG